MVLMTIVGFDSENYTEGTNGEEMGVSRTKKKWMLKLHHKLRLVWHFIRRGNLVANRICL